MTTRARRLSPPLRVLLLAMLTGVAACTGSIETPAGAGAPRPPRSPGADTEVGVPQGGLSVFAEAVSSSRVTLRWPAPDNASRITVTLGTEAPTDDEGTLGGPTRTWTLEGAATEFEVPDLAAGTDAFFRVSAEGPNGATRWGTAHARTQGGPGAPLDSPLRSAHGYGTRTLLLVIADPETRFDEPSRTHVGDDGARWQGGTWEVTRADGSALAVTRVHRHTVPAGQPDYPVGFEVYGDGKVVNLEHRIFLELDEPIGERELLRITHAEAQTELAFTLPFSDRYLETSLIQLNQVGYSPRAKARYAYVSGYMGDGGGSDLAGLGAAAELVEDVREPLLPDAPMPAALPIRERAAKDPDAAARVLEIDLRDAPAAEGVRYRIRIPGVGVSWPTAVSEEATFKAFFTVARGLYLNRWCGDLDPAHTDWARDADHCGAHFVSGYDYHIVQFPKDTPLTNYRVLKGGHHDAGDFDIRPYHVLVGQYLLRAVELADANLADGQLDLPESGNGIPDLLDEALWSLAGWEALQNPDGSVRAGVETWADPRGIHFANEDELPYWTWDPVPWHTAYVAALFAQGARLVAPFDAARASALRTAAEKAYGAPIAQSAPAAYRLYAASELFALTGDAKYGDAFKALWRSLDRYGRGAFDAVDSMLRIYPGAFTGHAPTMADYVVGYAKRPDSDPSIVAVIRSELLRLADESADAVIQSPHAHRHGRPANAPPDWGHASATGRHADRIYQALDIAAPDTARRQRYIDAMALAADYALGANPLGMSFITGLGSRMPQQPLHLDSLASQATGMPAMPGIPVYGPVSSLPNVYYYWPVTDAHYPSFSALPLGRRYADSRTSVNTAEFTVWENQAPLAELFGALLGAPAMPPATWRAGGTAHRTTLTTQR